MLTFSKRMILIEKYREGIEMKSAKLGMPLPYCPEGFLVFLNEIGIIDEAAVLSFIFKEKEEEG